MKCYIGGCDKDSRALGLCAMHRKRLKRHGDPNIVSFRVGLRHTGHPLYSTYCGMKQRCSDPNSISANSYYGRGIRVCDRWLGVDGFTNFVKDVGDKPTPSHTLDRVNSNGDYEPGNVRWATRLEQVYNRRVFRNNKVGITGVSWDRRAGKWVAQARIDGHKKWLGYFDSIEAATQAYRVAVSTR